MRFVFIAFLSFATCSVQAGDLNTFGVDLMLTKSDIACDDVEETVINDLYATSCEDSSTGFRLYLKRQVGETVSLETGYVDFGEVGWDAEFMGFPGDTDGFPIVQSTVDFSAKGLDFAVRKDFNADSFLFFVKFGLTATTGKYRFSRLHREDSSDNDPPSVRTDSKESMSPLYGFGFQKGWFETSYVIYKNLGTDDIGESDVSALIVGVRF